MPAKASIHVLIVLGRIGRYWGDRGETLDERVRAAEKALKGRHLHFTAYDQIFITGGKELSPELSNAELLHVALTEAVAASAHPPDRVRLHTASCRNQVALIEAVDAARLQWPSQSIRFDVVTSAYAVPRMRGYLEHHINQLTELHGDTPSPRQLFWTFREAENPVFAPLRNRLREWAKRQVDLRRPNPIPLVKVN